MHQAVNFSGDALGSRLFWSIAGNPVEGERDSGLKPNTIPF